jgi:hypothetical protein
MRIDGKWRQCDDGIARPIIAADVRASDDSWIPIWLLVDSGADRTVFCADDFARLRISPTVSSANLGGVGGVAKAISVVTQIQMLRDDDRAVIFRGEFAALSSTEALDISVLGRDITDQFAVITDRPGDVVTMIGQRHLYRIEFV